MADKVVTFGPNVKFVIREVSPGYRVATPVEDKDWFMKFIDIKPKGK
jgi:hypothetical protein